MSNSRLGQTEKALYAQLQDPQIDPKSRVQAIKGLAAIAIARLKLTTMRERQKAREKAQKETRKSFGLMD
jgi:hypothetical protein